MSSGLSSTPSSDGVGRVIQGPDVGSRFELLSLLGTGSFGSVYAARDRTYDTKVALKLLHHSSAEAIYRFKREFRALRDLRHPNLVRYGELLEHEGRWFFTLELVSGCSLLEYVRPRPDAPADAARIRHCMRKLAEGLLALHAQGMVHRDIKPTNVLVDARGRLVILDFGLVADEQEGLGATRNVVGTVAYMSPEQATGEPLTPASDWYGVGCMLYEALTGRMPFEGGALQVLLEKQRSQPTRPSMLRAGVPPDLEELCMGLLATKPAQRASARDVLRALDAVPSHVHPSSLAHAGNKAVVPFFGRDAELTLLDAAMEQSARGESVGVAVSGESGMGKTALVSQAVSRFRERHANAVVLFGRCYERESVPYNAFDGVIDELTRVLRKLPAERVSRLSPRRAELLPLLFPVLDRIPALTRASRGVIEDDPQAQRSGAFAALREVFQRLSDDVPLAIVIDDLQWSDDESLALLEELVRAPDPPRLLLAVTLRPSEECRPAVVQGLERVFGHLDRAQHLALRGLLPDDAVELARFLSRHLSTAHQSGDLRSLIEDAGGHPLFIDTLVRSQRQAEDEEGQRASVEEALRHVVAGLSVDARAALQAICLAGVGTSLSVVAHATHLTPEHCDEVIHELLGKKLVRPEKRDAGLEVESFHDRVRTAVVRALPGAQTRDLHARLAEAMVAVGRAAPERVAAHFRAAGRDADAFAYVREAAQTAAAALAFDRAARLYAEAIELALEPELQLYEGVAQALANAGRGAEAQVAYRKAAELADGAAKQELLRLAAEQCLRAGLLEPGLELVTQVLEGAGESLGRSPRSAVLALLWERSRLFARGFAYTPKDEQQCDAQRLRHVDLLWSLGVALSSTDHVRSTALLTRSLRAALSSGEERRVSRGLATEAISLSAIEAPPFKRITRLLSMSHGLAERRGDAYTRAFHDLCSAGVALAARDQYAECVEHASSAQRLFGEQCRGVAWELGQARLFELGARAFLGDYRELRTRSEELMREAQTHGDRLVERSIATTARTWALLSEDRPLAAQHLLQQHQGQGESLLVQDVFRVWSEAVVGLYLRDRTLLSRLDAVMPALSGSMLLRVRLFRVQFHAWHARAALLCARETSRPEQARLLRVVQGDLKVLRACQTHQALSHVALIEAASHRLRGDERAELEALSQAHALWQERACLPFTSAIDLRRAKLLGGSEGESLRVRAAAFFEREGVVNPRRLSAVFVV